MKMKINHFILFCSLLVVVTACTYTEKDQQIDLEFECIDSFETFAFSRVGEDEEPLTDILPGSPWEIEFTLPSSPIQSDKAYYGLLASRNVSGENEIWLRHTIIEGKSRTSYIVSYQDDTQELTPIVSTDEIENSGVVLSKIFFLENGEIWGSNSWVGFSVSKESKVDSFPILSKLNPDTHSFEFVQSSLEFQLHSFDHPIVLLDKEGVFWIIQSKDGIYRYDPSQEKTELIKKLDKDVRDAVLTPYGGIFIVYRNISSPPIFTFQEGDLLYYDIELGSLSEITPPEEIWPSIYTIAVDSAGNLWLDSNGWRTPDGEWHLINTYIDKESLATGIGVDWTTARHLATSSNGFVWLYKLPNIGQHTGQAWYDTKSREGCWFTTDFYSLMIEDADQNLWMILDDKLYKLDLDS